MPYKAAIFDLDGTLLNTIDDLADAANDALTEAGLPTHSPDSYKLMVGSGVRNLIKRVLPKDNRQLETVLKSMRRNYAACATRKTKPYADIHQALLQLRDNNIKLAVLTNKDERFSVHLIEHYFGPDLFTLVFGAMQGRPIKPDPAALLQLIDQLEIQPPDAVFIGDSGVDMDVAHAAGIDSIGVTWGFRPKSELIEHHADLIIDKPNELLQAIGL